MNKRKVMVASAQFDIKIFDKDYNLKKIEQLFRNAVEEKGAELVVFPEASVSGYCFNNIEECYKAGIKKDGDELKCLKELSAKYQASMVVGAVEIEGEDIYNTAFFIEPTGTVYSYRKTHLPYLGLDRFAKRGEKIEAFDSGMGKMGMIICYDLRFPEPMRKLALQGAELVIQPTNLPLGGEAHCDFLSRARACENHVMLISCNRCGEERGVKFFGRSQIVDISGKLLAEAGEDEQIIAAEINLDLSNEKDIIVEKDSYELHLFSDRRTDIYENLGERDGV